MHLLILAIGPVQEFIESARKCRDLWFGSWLLSELSRAAAAEVVAAEGRAESDVLVFPGAKVDKRERAVANKIVARVVGRPAEVAERARRKMNERLAQVRDRAFAQVRDRAFAQVGKGGTGRAELFREATAREQVDGLIEFLWASAALEGTTYRAALDEAERLLAAVKNTKLWGQPSWAMHGVPKSSLDGVRESVLHEALYPNPRGEARSLGLAETSVRRAFGIHRNERLCGVGLLKRFGSVESAEPRDAPLPERIFSTSHVASGPFRAALAAHGAGPELFSSFVRDLHAIDSELIERLDVVPAGRQDPVTGAIDGMVFYEGRLDEALEELGHAPGDDPFFKARRALRSFLSRVGLGEPTPYYALLLADGDRMGAAIAAIDDFVGHRRLSDDLACFASSVRKLMLKHEGALVYAGGDDVLALLPLHTALACARVLAHQFAADLKAHTTAEGASPTLSMGVAVVHHLMPLDEALALVRKAEKTAKGVEGKNALCVVVKRRGGEGVSVAGRWGDVDARLDELERFHREGRVSARTQYELMDLHTRTVSSDDEVAHRLARVREAEARRILARKRAEGGGRRDDAAIERLEALGAFDDPARLGRELYVASVLAQATQQASTGAENDESVKESA